MTVDMNQRVSAPAGPQFSNTGGQGMDGRHLIVLALLAGAAYLAYKKWG